MVGDDVTNLAILPDQDGTHHRIEHGRPDSRRTFRGMLCAVPEDQDDDLRLTRLHHGEPFEPGALVKHRRECRRRRVPNTFGWR